MNEAMDQAIERLALRLVMRRDMGSATPQTEDDARRLVQCWTDGHRRGGNVAHDALSEQSPELMTACIRRLVWGEPPKLITRCANKQDLADIAEGRPVFRVADEKQVRRYIRNGPVCSRCMKAIGAATRAPFDRRAP